MKLLSLAPEGIIMGNLVTITIANLDNIISMLQACLDIYI